MTMNFNEFYQKRFQAYHQSLLKYIKMIFNDHLVLLIFLLIGAGGYAYQKYLTTLSAESLFPRIVILILFLLVTQIGAVATLIEKPDAAFIMPKEYEMKQKLLKAWLRSFLMSILPIGLVLMIVSPMLLVLDLADQSEIIMILITLCLLKNNHLIVQLLVMFEKHAQQSRLFKLVQQMAAFLLTLLMMSGYLGISFSLSFVTFLLSGFYLVTLIKDPKTRLSWQKAISQEEKRMVRLWRIVSVFVDVPKLTAHVNRLKFLDPLLDLLSENISAPSHFYLLRVTARDSGYRAMHLRLSILGILLTLISDSFLMIVLIQVLFIFLTGYQLISLANHLNRQLYFNLYPESVDIKRYSICKVIVTWLILEGLVFSLAAMISIGWMGLLTLFIHLIFILIFVNFFLARRILHYFS